VKFFGKDRRIDSITTGEAITWFERMLNGDKKGKGMLAEATARKMVGVARQVFKRALKFKHITENPFVDDELKTTVGVREKDYIALSTIQQLISIMPSVEWRAVIVFARFGAMRVQSELPLLKWSDVNWDENYFVVRKSPKTKKTRRTPIFPEVRQILEELRPITGKSEYVLDVMRTKSSNWRTPLDKMMVKAGIKPWADLFNALRSSGGNGYREKTWDRSAKLNG
jgi:integrase